MQWCEVGEYGFLKHNLFATKKGKGAASFVSGHQLINAVRTHFALKRKSMD
jgi:hypothetical protein